MEPSHNLDLHQATLGAIGAIGANYIDQFVAKFQSTLV